MKKELQELKKNFEVDIHLDSQKETLKKYQIGKHQALMVYMISGLKIFISIHDKLALQLIECQEEVSILQWTMKGKTTLIQKDYNSLPILSNYRPITCLPIMRKILTTQLKEEIYYCHGQFPEEQKGCHKKAMGTDDLLYID